MIPGLNAVKAGVFWRIGSRPYRVASAPFLAGAVLICCRPDCANGKNRWGSGVSCHALRLAMPADDCSHGVFERFYPLLHVAKIITICHSVAMRFLYQKLMSSMRRFFSKADRCAVVYGHGF